MSLNTNAAGGAGGDARVGVGVGAGAFALCAAAVLLWNKNQKKNSSSDCRGGGRGRGSVDSGKRENALLEDTSCTISAPGKILVAGGYLVLERPNIGITLAATSRFYASVCEQEHDRVRENLLISVESPQFHTSYSYSYDLAQNSLSVLSGSGNEFVEKCLSLTLSFARKTFIVGESSFEAKIKNMASNKKKLAIKLRADNDFYSQIKELQSRNAPLLSESLKQLPTFYPCPKDENGKVLVAKTGMGSSAAMTTALVGAILHFFGVVNLQDDVRGLRHDSKSTHVSPEADTRSKSTVHNLAQLAHAVAQGKIGSGFDVSAAVYGSQIYQRFNQDNFKDEYASISQQKICDDALFNCVTNEELWDQTVAPLQLPPGLDVVMGDVMGGSSSSSMARGVLKWKNSSADAPAIWNGLADNNKAISQVLGELLQASKVHVHAYKTVILRASKVPHTEWKELVCDGAAEKDIVDLLLYTKAKFKKSRELLKRMGDCAGQGIEPAEQTALADDTEALPGVLCAGVPGAGGVDAIFAITLSTGARSGVEEMWSQRDNNGGFVCPLMLSTSSEKSGICFEKNISWD